MSDQAKHADRFRLGEWSVDPALDEVSCGTDAFKLEPRTMSVLVYLALRPGEVVSQAELEKQVWKGLIVTPQSVYQSIAQLRRVLGDDARVARYIATVPRKGYRLIAPVHRDPDASVSPTVARTANPRRGRSWVMLAGVLAALAVATLTFVLWPRPVARPVTIAVLPFTDLSAEHDNGAFCDGLTEELMSMLAQLAELRVIARNSSFLFRERPGDVRAIGAQLGVSHVLEGSVRRHGDQVRISASLVDAANGFKTWTESYNRPADQILRIQQDIAREVVRALQVRLSPARQGQFARIPTEDVSAYELYLLGRFHQQQRKPQALERAVQFHTQAIARDPRFALAHAGLADALMAGHYYQGRPLEQTAALVEPAVNDALEIEPGLAEAYAARAVLRTEQFRLDEAIADLQKAVALKPNYAEAMVRLGAAYEYRAQPRRAISAYDEAMDLDPLHFILHVRRCLTLQNLGRYTDAQAACRRGLELQPDLPNGHWTTGLLALSRGDLVAAIGGYERALQRAPQRADLLEQLGTLLLDVGEPEQALLAFDRALASGAGNEQFLRLERANYFVALDPGEALARELRALSIDQLDDAQLALDAALLELVAGNERRAGELASHAERLIEADAQGATTGRLFAGVWGTRWGRSPILTLALSARLSGDARASAAYLQRLEQWLARVEEEGHVWHGARYLRASVLALRGETSGALEELEQAVSLGWRRAWWMRADPALAALRREPRFAALLGRIDALNAASRGALKDR